MVSCIVLAALGDIGGRNRELGVDLVQGMLGRRESELVLEEGGFGRIPVRVGQVQTLHRIQQLLGLLDEVGEVEHGDSLSWGVKTPSTVQMSYGRCLSREARRGGGGVLENDS